MAMRGLFIMMGCTTRVSIKIRKSMAGVNMYTMMEGLKMAIGRMASFWSHDQLMNVKSEFNTYKS